MITSVDRDDVPDQGRLTFLNSQASKREEGGNSG